ncbi:hypothetical protein Glove_136g103 [Diversispora epigaea]|uniref:non-specific serine/threonine protein kinase n=1 Tax=Diversispora epigaea TaxID=1348612 RepID=A0A397J5F5_9GLOM|nr:hypothetical protein Glove_136g103 [Diversispora epigaea]
MATHEIDWNDKLRDVWYKSFYSLNVNIHKTITEQEKYRKYFVENDSSLTGNEKKFLFNELQRTYDTIRIDNDSEKKQQCNDCQNWHRATQYCEFCIRKYLENDFGNWTSGNGEIDKLIQECQQKTIAPDSVIEWIEYDQFENIELLTEGGCSTIYTATWKDGYYDKWNPERRTLERLGGEKIVLKRLNDSNNNNVRWFQEVTLSFTLDKTSTFLALCYGLSKDPRTQDFILVLWYYDNDLRHFLKENYDSLTLLQKYRIICKVATSLHKIHKQDTIHRDLHSGNILHHAPAFFWYISDLGFSGPVEISSNSFYGNLPYIAPEVICGEIYTPKSDIYSLGIIMWEVITGETPFGDYERNDEHENDDDYEHYLTLYIVKGFRPKIYEYIPNEYVTLMKQCWDANPDNRPDANRVCEKMKSLIKPFYDTQPKDLKSKIKKFFKLKLKKDKNNQEFKNTRVSKNTERKTYRTQNSKIHTFNIPIKPRNATDEEQQEFDSKQFDLEITDEIQQQYLKSIGVDNSKKSCEYEVPGPSNPGS